MHKGLAETTWTYERYCSLPEDGQRYEVIDGQLFVTPAPRMWHQIASKRIQALLYILEQRGDGWVFEAPTDLLMPGCSPVQPDLFWLAPDQAASICEDNIVGVPGLVVEILSPSSAGLDRVVKLNRYARSGVPLYWLVDPRERSLERLELVDGRYVIQAALRAGSPEEESVFEFRGVTFDLDEIFRPIPGSQLVEIRA